MKKSLIFYLACWIEQKEAQLVRLEFDFTSKINRYQYTTSGLVITIHLLNFSSEGRRQFDLTLEGKKKQLFNPK